MYTRHLLHVSDVRNFLLFARFRCMQFSFFRTYQIYALIVFYCTRQIYAFFLFLVKCHVRIFLFFYLARVICTHFSIFCSVGCSHIFFARFRCLHISISYTCQMYAFLYFSQCWTYAFSKKKKKLHVFDVHCCAHCLFSDESQYCYRSSWCSSRMVILYIHKHYTV